jgi:peptidoglycan/LPS O-acetylase OafA/YrhL
MAAPREATGRLIHVDVLKGFAALWVLLIHAEALRGEIAMDYVFNRAAQIFVVLMGLNAEIWWRKRDRSHLGEWAASRFRRLYLPMWCAVAVWWAMASVAGPGRHLALSPGLLVKHVAGYVVGIGTGWFVTLAIAVAIFFPLLHAARRRVGAWPLVALGVASTCACFVYRYEILHRLGMFGWYSFPPRLLAHVAFGMAIAPFAATLGWRAARLALGACAVYVGGPLLFGAASPWQLLPESGFGASSATACANRLMDLPVTVLLLVACRGLAGAAWLARPFVWLGNESYAIYLGQMVTHNALTMFVGFAAAQAALGSGGYALVLLAGALAWVVAGRALGHLVAAVAPPVRARAVAGTGAASRGGVENRA